MSDMLFAMIAHDPKIKQLIDDFLAASLMDPDLVAASEDYRRGYERGFREAMIAAIKMKIAKRGAL
jgi:hypothetical protein